MGCVFDLNLTAINGARLSGQVDRHRDPPAVAVRGQARDELVQALIYHWAAAVH